MSKAVKKPELGKFITVRVTPKFHTQFHRKVKAFGPRAPSFVKSCWPSPKTGLSSNPTQPKEPLS